MTYGSGQPSSLARLFSRVEVTGDCWMWAGPPNRHGYGEVRWNGAKWLVHRLVYTLLVGPIPPGLDAGHTCHDVDRLCAGGPTCAHRRCVKPGHVIPQSRSENLSASGRMGSALKDECSAGHPFDAANTKVWPDGRRECRECRKRRKRESARRARSHQ